MNNNRTLDNKSKMKYFSLFLLLIVVTSGQCSCQDNFTKRDASPSTDQGLLYKEKYRPQFHFSPKSGWIGDPDGTILFKDVYHLFWWGHATSKDMVFWQEMPYPMQGGDKSFTYFSGGAVVDKNNTAGFGDSAIIAIYTMHMRNTNREMQGLSYSTDEINFHFYDKNPVLDLGTEFFRDPTVFWHEPTNRWIMILVIPNMQKASLYASHDLKDWQYLSDFGPTIAESEAWWEVPDLFQLPIDNDVNNKKWVLTVGHGPNKMRYFLGEFDGERFTPDTQTIMKDQQKGAFWADYGKDFYAARTWRNYDDSENTRTTWIGWLGNWDYARIVPTEWGKGFVSIPRDLSLRTTSDGIKLIQLPIPELKMLRRDSISIGNILINHTKPFEITGIEGNTYELVVQFEMQGSSVFGLNLLVGEGRKLILGYDPLSQKLFLDRTNCTDHTADSTFTKSFSATMNAPLKLENSILDLHIFVDKSSVEVFAKNGEVTVSCLTFPSIDQTSIEAFTQSGEVKILELKAWKLSSIWAATNN